MDTKEAIKHVRSRLSSLNAGFRLTWSLDDRAAVSHLGLRVQRLQEMGIVCPECDSRVMDSGYCMMGHWCGKPR